MPQCTLPLIYNLTSSKFSVIMSMISGTPVQDPVIQERNQFEKPVNFFKPDDVTLKGKLVNFLTASLTPFLLRFEWQNNPKTKMISDTK